jgi:hypothetical protein
MRRTILGMIAVLVATSNLLADGRPRPKEYPPMVARASLENGTMSVRIPWFTYENKKTDGKDAIVRVAKEHVVRLELKDVQTFDFRGRKVGPEALRDRLKVESHILVTHNGPADPYYLEVVKKGTLIVVVPIEKMPGIPPAELPETGAKDR